MTAAALPAGIDEVAQRLAHADYVADRGLATATFVALRLGRPLLLEGEPGTGKTEIARALAASLDRRLIRLQCYEGLDLASAAYEWNYPRQLVELRLRETGAAATTGRGRASAGLAAHRARRAREEAGRRLFGRDFLIRRPLAQALEDDPRGAPVLLIDELDRADEPFEAFLLEILADYQISIPEYGTLKAAVPPIVVLTSNRTREIHDAIRRRCIYHWVDFPDARRELEILRRRVPGAAEALSRQVVGFVQRLRGEDLFKLPGVAETLEWTRALMELDVVSLDPAVVESTLGVLLKYQDDIAKVTGSEAARLLAEVQALARS